MSLPTVAQLKSYLRVETATEDTLLGILLANATAILVEEIGIPLVAVSKVMVDRGEVNRVYGSLTALLVDYPLDTTTGFSVKDVEGATVDPATYDLSEVNETGIIRAAPGQVFPSAPYTITALVGLDKHPRYGTSVEALLAQCIYDVVSDLYSNRRPNVKTESDPGVSTTFRDEALSPRTRAALAKLKKIVA